MKLRSICIYCGSSPGRSTDYADQARRMAQVLAEQSITIVYGGGKNGLMGVVADAALAVGGKVIGVMPRSLVDKEVAHRGLTELHVVESMHDRKALMADLSDGFIALPGGVGTFEELFEMWTWGQLEFHRKPCGLLNASSYFDLLAAFLNHATTEGFIKVPHREMLVIADSAEDLLSRFMAYEPPTVKKWILHNET